MRWRWKHLVMIYWLVLPILVVTLGWGYLLTILAMVVGVMWFWLSRVSHILIPPKNQPRFVLETISASHFVEKVRWCMDRLGIEYEERPNVGVLGVFLTGRSVPKLFIRTGMVTSEIGNSSDILRYLWGMYYPRKPEQAAFLEPTPETIELEKRLDRYGYELQCWIYGHALPYPALTRHAWGQNDPRLPRWQRWLLPLFFPVLRFFMNKAFRLGPKTKKRCKENIEALVQEIEEKLSDGREYLMGDSLSYIDITFAALSSLWAIPQGYGGGQAESLLPTWETLPPEMAAEMRDWHARFPYTMRYIQKLYDHDR